MNRKDVFLNMFLVSHRMRKHQRMFKIKNIVECFQNIEEFIRKKIFLSISDFLNTVSDRKEISQNIIRLLVNFYRLENELKQSPMCNEAFCY